MSISSPRSYPSDIGLRLLVTVVGGLGALALGSAAFVWPVRVGGLVLIQGQDRREIPFRTIESWSLGLGTTLALGLGEGEAVSLSRWRKQGDMNAAIITAIRLAGATFAEDGRLHRVRWP